MTILFNLSYFTQYGENLILNLLSPDGGKVAEQLRMATTDGSNWIVKKELDGQTTISYYYSVEKNGAPSRHEWLLEPHRLKFSGFNKAIVFDKWIDIPEDSYLYSSAITDCIAKRDSSAAAKPPRIPPRSTRPRVILKVRAPQLRHNERLAILGNVGVLGNWEALKAYPMTEENPNEWVANLEASGLEGNVEFKFVVLDDKIDFTPLWEDGANRTISIPPTSPGEAVVYELSPASFPIYPWKAAGTVVPVFSLRSEGSFGVGDFGDLASMIEWVAQTGQRVLQILPIYDTTITHTWTDSYPYNSISIYALHPQYIDLRQLPSLRNKSRMEYYEKLRLELNSLSQIDYEKVNETKLAYLRELYAEVHISVLRSAPFLKFFASNKDWLVPYAAFCLNRDKYGTADFNSWPDNKSLDPKLRSVMETPKTSAFREAAFWYYIQYVLDSQLKRAHEIARSLRVILKGDIPIGISREGVEAWVEPKYFNMDGQAGAPPDPFSVNGQNWGFPTYNWNEMLQDGCSWWVRRFRKMSEYFDAYRIDHVLGFFRIWEIPSDSVHGLLGHFSPSLPMTKEEIESYGLRFDEKRYTNPFITDWVLDRVFGEMAEKVKATYLDPIEGGYKLKAQNSTQRKIESLFPGTLNAEDIRLRDGLYSLVSDVLFLRDKDDPGRFHPRIAVQHDFIYESLSDGDKTSFNNLYNDYYYRRHNQFWYQEAMKKLPLLTQATRMLVCAEDLGMVPECVPWVINELRILSLEIQSMPKDSKCRFGHLSQNPYRSVSTISTHDMPTLRQWWDEDETQTQEYFSSMLHRGGGAPHPLPGWLAEDIIMRHLMSPSMLCLLSIQDWLAMDEKLRISDADSERINIPANPRHYWRYRMHLTIEQLKASSAFNENISTLIKQSGRKG